MNTMLRITLSALAALLVVVAAAAQQIQVVDRDGDPIPFVCITNADGVLIGTTDIDGQIADIKGAATVSLSHVAYKDITVSTAEIADGRITMEDVDFNLPEVIVKPKELIYVQTYYRLIYVSDNEGPIYFRAGVIDNAYDIEKKKMSTKARSLSKGKNGFYRFLLSTLAGRHIDKMGSLDRDPYHTRIEKAARDGKLLLAEDPRQPARTLVSDSVAVLGFIENDTEQLLKTTSFDYHTYRKHRKAAEIEANPDKKISKRDKKLLEDEDTHETNFEVYRIGSDNRSSIADFVMRQEQVEGTFSHSDEAYIIFFQAYNTDVNYVDKKEYKQLRKENKVDMDIDELRRFEQAHRIPELAPNLQSAVDRLFKKDK